MAQVRKYKTSGSLPETEAVVTQDSILLDPIVVTADGPKPKTEPERVGSFTLRSDKLLGQEALDKINEVNKTNLGIFSSAAARALKDKLDVIVDEQGFRIMDGDTDVTDKYITDKRVAKMDDRTFAKNLGATFNSHKHQQRLNFEALWNLDLSKPEPAPAPVATSDSSGNTDDGTSDGTSDGISGNTNVDNNVPLPSLEGFDSGIGSGYGISGLTAHDDGNGGVYYTIDGWDRGTFDLDTDAGNKIFGNTIYKRGWIDDSGRLWDYRAHETNASLGNATEAYRLNPGTTMATWAENAANSGVHIFDNNPFQTNWTNYNPTSNFVEGNIAFNNLFRGQNKDYGLLDVSENFKHLGLGKVYAIADPTDFGTSHGTPTVRYITENGVKLTPEQASQINHNVRNLNPSVTLTNYGGDNNLNPNQTLYGSYSNGKTNTGVSIVYERGDTPEEDKYYVYQQKANGKFRDAIQLDPKKLQNVIDYIRSADFLWKGIEKDYSIKSRPTQSSQNTSADVDTYDRSASYTNRRGKTYTVSEKQGGKIDWDRLGKYQWGGAISTNKTVSTVDQNFNNDIQKGHDVKGTEAGFTKAEKLQIAGAMADLSGVLASFAPGIVGGVAGAGVGVTGTALRFAGDVKKDGLDWGDVGRGILNFAFDVAAVPASLLPAGDNAIKGAKLVRTIKSVGTPLLKWMGTMGCASSVINTASKIINGEKYTSEDLVSLAQGLAGGIVAGKQWAKQVGDAKLAAKLSSKVISKAKANVPTETGGIKNEKLASIVKNAKGNKAKITEAIRKELKLADDAEVDLTKFGIKSGPKGVWEFVTRKDARQIFEAPEKPKETSTLEYFLRGKKRDRALGYRKPSKGQQNLLGEVSQREYDLLMARGAGNGNATISSAVRRAALNNGKAFGFEFDGTKTTSAPWQFGWRNRYSLSKHVVEPTVTSSAPVVPNSPESAQFRQWANANPQAAREFTTQLRNKFTTNKFKPTSIGLKNAYFNRKLNATKVRFGWRFKKGGSIPKFGLGGLTGDPYELNINPADFLDLGQAIASNAKLNKAYRHEQNALNDLKRYNAQSVHLATPTLFTGDIAQKYNAARNSYNSAIGPNVYGDSKLQAANKQAQAQNYSNLAMQEGAETSTRVAENNAQTLNILNQNKASGVATANENLKYQTGLQYQTDMLKSQQIRDKEANIWQPFSHQIRQEVRDKYNAKQQAKLAYKQKEFAYDYDIKRRALLKPVYDMYNADTSQNKGSFNDWVANNAAAYKKYQEIINSDAYKKWDLEQYKKQLSFYKSGGSTYKHKTVEEELAINGDRMSKKAVAKMSDNLHKMLLQLLK